MRTPNLLTHNKLRNYLLNLVHHQTDSVPIPSERELAASFHLARETVRRTLEAVVREKYLICRPRKGYFTNPAHICKFERKRKIIGVLIGNGGQCFYSFDELSFLEPLYAEALTRHLTIQMLPCCERETMCQTLMNSNMDGFLWFNAEEDQFRQLNEKASFPTVALFNRPVSARTNCILLDHRCAGKQEVQVLLQAGCRHIAFIPWHYDFGEQMGALEELKQIGMYEPDLFLPPDDWKTPFMELFNAGRIQGVIAYGDTMTELLRLAEEQDIRLPRDLQLVGNWVQLDDQPTMLKKPHETIVKTMMETLHQAMTERTHQPMTCIETWNVLQGETTRTTETGTILS